MAVPSLTRRNLLIVSAIFGAGAMGGLLPSACAMLHMTQQSGLPTGKSPKRPKGKPKAQLDEDIRPVLERLEKWYNANLPSDKYVFNAPATDTEIYEIEQVIGITLPSSYHQLYKWHNGENDDRRGHIYGLPLLPLKQVAAEWSAWSTTLASFGGNRYAIPGAAWPEGAVDPAYINPAWVPLTSDGSGGHIGLDFDPWPGGRIGQVILFGRDEDVKVVVAESLGQFLEWVAGLLESGNVRLHADADGVMLREFRLKEPPSDNFHQGARTLLNAPGPFL